MQVTLVNYFLHHLSTCLLCIACRWVQKHLDDQLNATCRQEEETGVNLVGSSAVSLGQEADTQGITP